MVLNGRNAIYEALVTRDADFADRIYSAVEAEFNPGHKGTSVCDYFN